MTKKNLVCLLLHFVCFIAMGQTNSVAIRFSPHFGNELLVPEKKYISAAHDTLQVNTLKFYISKFRLHFTDGSSTTDAHYHLLDLQQPQSWQFNIGSDTQKKLSRISFDIGVDSTACASGALSGDLDPINGMYWAWQSGYVNMKIEGRSRSCKTRKNEFEFHIGGYLKPNYALRSVSLPVSAPDFEIVTDLAALFAQLQLSETNSIMIPGAKAMRFADQYALMFSIE